MAQIHLKKKIQNIISHPVLDPGACYVGENCRSKTSCCSNKQNGRSYRQLGCQEVILKKRS